MSKGYEQLKEEHAAKKKEERKKLKEPPLCQHKNIIYLGDAIRNGLYTYEIRYCKDCEKFLTQSD